MTATFFLLPLPPSEIIGGMALFAEEACPDMVVRNFQANSPLTDFQLAEKNKFTGKKLRDNPQFKDNIAVIARNPYLEFYSCSLTIATAQGQDLVLTWHANETPPNLKLTLPDQVPPNERLRFTEILHKHLSLLRREQLLTEKIDPINLPLAKFSETAVQNLAAQGARLVQLSAEQIKEFNRILIDKTESLEKLYREKEESLSKAYAEKEATLSERIRIQSAKESAFDLRENTVVRRAIFDQLLKIIDDQKKVEVTAETQTKRAAIQRICWGLLGLGATMILVGLYRIMIASTFDWPLIFPVTSGLLLAASTAIYYLRWSDQWFRDFADAEFSNRKFKADMTRAAWLVEMFFEWDQKKGTPLPPELIASCTSNLFTPEARGGTRHPLDDLGALAKEFSKIRIGKGALEVEREPKSDK